MASAVENGFVARLSQYTVAAVQHDKRSSKCNYPEILINAQSWLEQQHSSFDGQRSSATQPLPPKPTPTPFLVLCSATWIPHAHSEIGGKNCVLKKNPDV